MKERDVRAHGEYGDFEGDPSDRVVFAAYRTNGTWSPALVSLIAERLFQRGPGTFVDVGAHIGLVAIPVLERSRASAIAFEPEPRNHAYLRRNLRTHGLEDRATLHALALDERAGRATLAISADNSGDHRLVSTQQSPPTHAAQIEVATARLDDLLADVALTAPVVMKLDCQGAEARVLRGAARTIARTHYMIVEYWPAGLLRMGDSAEVLQTLLRAFPYCALLEFQSLEGRLRSPAELFAQMAFIPTDGTDEGFFDILLSRHEILPRS